MAILTTTLTEIPHRRIAEVLGVVLGEDDGVLAAYAAMEDLANQYDADAIIDVRTTASGASDGEHRARFRAIVIGTAVRLDRAEGPV